MDDQVGIGEVFVIFLRNLDQATKASASASIKQRRKAAETMTRREVGDRAWSQFMRRQNSPHPLTAESRSVRRVMAKHTDA